MHGTRLAWVSRCMQKRAISRPDRRRAACSLATCSIRCDTCSMAAVMTETRRAFRALDEAALVALATDLAGRTHDGGVIFLEGELGAGKTTFARALLRARGVGERVKSPTYSLIESYSGSGHPAHHLDLYRIADPGELEWLGLADLVTPGALLLVEWPERG